VQQIDGFLERALREVHVPHCHGHALVTSQLLDRLRRRSPHGEVRAEGVAKGVCADAPEPGLPADAIEAELDRVTGPGLAARLAEDKLPAKVGQAAAAPTILVIVTRVDEGAGPVVFAHGMDGGAAYSNASSRMRPNIGARVQLLRQDAHSIDGALGVSFKTEDFTEPEGEIEVATSIGRQLGPVYLMGNLPYGQDPEGNERDGELRAALFGRRGRFPSGV
jgi:hypothetical protein